MPLPRPTSKYVGRGPLTLARLTHKFEGDDDIEFLAIQDAVSTLTTREQEIYRQQYVELFKSPPKH